VKLKLFENALQTIQQQIADMLRNYLHLRSSPSRDTTEVSIKMYYFEKVSGCYLMILFEQDVTSEDV